MNPPAKNAPETRRKWASLESLIAANYEDHSKFTYAADSIGLVFDQEGRILNVVPGMAGDKAGLAPGMKVEGVNGRKFSGQRVKDAISDSVTKRQIEFLVLQGDTFRTFTLQYADGPKYLELVEPPSSSA